MTRLFIAAIAFGFILFSTACNKTELIEPQTVEPVENANPTEDERLGPCGQLSGIVRAYTCGPVLETNNGKVYELPAANDFEIGGRLSYQLQSTTEAEAECSEVLRVSFSCLQAWN